MKKSESSSIDYSNFFSGNRLYSSVSGNEKKFMELHGIAASVLLLLPQSMSVSYFPVTYGLKYSKQFSSGHMQTLYISISFTIYYPSLYFRESGVFCLLNANTFCNIKFYLIKSSGKVNMKQELLWCE